MAFLFDKVHKAVHEIGNDLKDKFSDHGQTQSAGANEQYDQSGYDEQRETHRFQSFAPHRIGNEAKWYVDGAGYMYAVSMAMERARDSIWIMDWWLSPELYLRRPPAQNEQYRVDRMLQAAAERGVQVSAAGLNPYLLFSLPMILPECCIIYSSRLASLYELIADET
jgi:phospholipase D1/2